MKWTGGEEIARHFVSSTWYRIGRHLGQVLQLPRPTYTHTHMMKRKHLAMRRQRGKSWIVIFLMASLFPETKFLQWVECNARPSIRRFHISVDRDGRHRQLKNAHAIFYRPVGFGQKKKQFVVSNWSEISLFPPSKQCGRGCETVVDLKK